MDANLDTISTADLAALLSRRRAAIDIAEWSREAISGGSGSARGGTELWRFRGLTRDRRPWSLALKVLHRRAGETMRSPYYWKREYEVYRSGLLEDLPNATFSTPKIYRVDDYGDRCWIWMEDVDDEKSQWTLADYRRAAKLLGQFNGAYLMGRPLPGQEWLTRDWHCAITPGLADVMDNLESFLEGPLARATLPMDAKGQVEAIWGEREIYINALKELPKALCHLDGFRRNMLHRQGEFVMIDWAIAGLAAVGEELTALVAVSLYHDDFSGRLAGQLEDTVFAGYVEGLRLAGWDGDDRLARIGYSCSMVLRGLAGVKQDILLLLMDGGNYPLLLENHGGGAIREVAAFFAEVRRFRLLRMAKEAKDLLRPRGRQG